MASVEISGNLTAAPTSGGTFPGGSAQFALSTTPDPKGSQCQASGVKQLNSPASFVALPGVGAGSDVSNADFVYVKTNAAVSVRITQGGVAQIVIVNGILLMEAPAGQYVTLVELEGIGTVEYLVSGQS